MALLTFTLNFFEYRYFVGKLNASTYTAIVASLFTAIGVWLASIFVRKQKVKQVLVPLKESSPAQNIQLNKREYEILQLIAQGRTNQQIADELFLALPTVKTHVSNLYSKLEVKSRTQAVLKAQVLKLI